MTGTTENIDPSTSLDSSAGTETFSSEQEEEHSIANKEVVQPLDYATQFEQETGYKDIHVMNEAQQKIQGDLQKRGDDYKNKFEQAQINSAILAGSSEAISADLIHEILGNKAKCDDGNVSINGTTVAEAVSSLLNEYPFLAKAQGDAGSGAPPSAGAGPSTLSRSAFQQLSQRKKSDFINQGGKVKD